jgi:hypothetical protein
MQLAHAFAHQAAISAFKEAERLDPDCAMCAWGEAWAGGPTINYPIDAKAQVGLARIADRAAALAKDGPAKERQLTAALERSPNDTGAIHFYIHATEMDGVAARALPYAERLERLAPSASHLVHMPSHTFFWTGRYGEAVSSNVDAVAVDQSNARRLGLGGDPFSLVYHGHNVSFGIGAAMIDGDGAAALDLARPALSEMSKGKSEPQQTQYAAARSFVAEGRYGPQAEVAALAQPGSDLPLARAMWRYARGEAAARRGDVAAVRAEAAGVQLTPDDLKRMGNAGNAPVVVQLARLTLDGRAAMLEHHPDVAARAFARAAALQDSKLHDSSDPPAWWYPSRRSLAAADLAAGKPADAAREARAVLARWPDEPLTLLVLARAETALGQSAEAEQHMAAVRRGWKGDLAAIGPAGL